VSVCLLDTTMSCAKTAEPIEKTSGLSTRVGQRNHVLGVDPDPPGDGAIWGDMSYPIMNCRDRESLRSALRSMAALLKTSQLWGIKVLGLQTLQHVAVQSRG